jgi:uncharacterized protein YndB with AHSA1/START domain
MKATHVAAILAMALTGSALARVESQGPSGFAVAYEADLGVAPADAYASFLRVGEWWSPDHTYSGDSRNLSITPRPEGCWCETLPDGGFVVHLRVVQVQPGQAIMFSGGLGPLAFMGVAGSMYATFKPAAEGTHVTLRYVVGGYDPDIFAKWPAGVDAVLNEGFERYKAFAAKR